MAPDISSSKSDMALSLGLFLSNDHSLPKFFTFVRLWTFLLSFGDHETTLPVWNCFCCHWFFGPSLMILASLGGKIRESSGDPFRHAKSPFPFERPVFVRPSTVVHEWWLWPVRQQAYFPPRHQCSQWIDLYGARSKNVDVGTREGWHQPVEILKSIAQNCLAYV